MNQYSITYAVAAEHSSLHCFSDSSFYLFSYEIDFRYNKEFLNQADYYAVWDPKEAAGQKLVDLRLLGKIVRIGYFDVVWKDRAEPIVTNTVYYKGVEPTDDLVPNFTGRLSLALRKLYESRHEAADRDITKTIAFVEVDKVFPILWDPIAYYFRKTLFPLELWFESEGVRISPSFANGKNLQGFSNLAWIVRLTQHFAYSYEKKAIFQTGVENSLDIPIEFGWNTVLKNKIIETLVENDFALSVEKLIESVWLGKIASSRSSRDLLDDLIGEMRKLFRKKTTHEEWGSVIRVEDRVVILSVFKD